MAGLSRPPWNYHPDSGLKVTSCYQGEGFSGLPEGEFTLEMVVGLTRPPWR